MSGFADLVEALANHPGSGGPAVLWRNPDDPRPHGLVTLFGGSGVRGDPVAALRSYLWFLSRGVPDHDVPDVRMRATDSWPRGPSELRPAPPMPEYAPDVNERPRRIY